MCFSAVVVVVVVICVLKRRCGLLFKFKHFLAQNISLLVLFLKAMHENIFYLILFVVVFVQCLENLAHTYAYDNDLVVPETEDC